jgi:hypothetical protein
LTPKRMQRTPVGVPVAAFVTKTHSTSSRPANLDKISPNCAGKFG